MYLRWYHGLSNYGGIKAKIVVPNTVIKGSNQGGFKPH